MSNETRRTLTQGLLGLLAGLLVASLAWAVVTIGAVRETQVDRAPQIAENDETLERIETLTATVEDCTRPAGKCYQRAQRQTGRSVASLNEVTIAAAACASGPVRRSVAEIQACVIDRLAAGPRGGR